MHPNKLSQKGNKIQQGPRGGKYCELGVSFSVTNKKKLGQGEKYYIESSQAQIQEAI
jgi:hypothetical protein